MAQKIPWIGTGWKMNKLRADALGFATTLRDSAIANTPLAQTFVLPPFPYIAEVADILKGTRVKVGAQNMHWEEQGPWTGEISAPMVKDCGATMVELGHSERRSFFNETDETVALKVKAAVKHGLLALVCIGDTKAEYDAGRTAEVLERQTRAALSLVGKSSASKVILAYEPVWSIGEGGVPADPDFANEQQRRIKAVTLAETGAALPILYGGSVNPQNCCALARQPHIDGLFIGRAAWNAAGFIGIVEAVISDLGEPS
ncbi:MAG: triose-phosphate isomerase [Rhizobiales bacterium]|nr:triose-phosphate isomerase [Hyphomicrobiales bacterium]MBP9173782.1 triose-phosphate isomerase [Hyphomicrobiales bacterium]MBZ0262929.1 triose-phosphate isomerase [Hyphomicrobiales bacterium]